MTMVGNATRKANAQAFIHTNPMFSTNPTLWMLITNDIKQDISNDIKKEKTYFSCLLAIKQSLHFL